MAWDIRFFPVLVGGADIPDVDRLIQALEEIVDAKNNRNKPNRTEQNKKTTTIAIISNRGENITQTIHITNADVMISHTSQTPDKNP